MGNPVFQTSGAWATVSTMGGTYFLQGGEYFDSKFTYVGPALPDFPTPMTMENTGSVNIVSAATRSQRTVVGPVVMGANEWRDAISVPPATSIAISTESSGTSVTNSAIGSTTAHGFKAFGADNIDQTVVSCTKINAAYYGVLVDATGHVGYKRIRVTGNDIVAMSADAVELNAPNGGGANTMFGTITALNFLQSPTGTVAGGFAVGLAAGKQNVILGNVALISNNQIIHIEDTQSGTVVVGNSGLGNSDGIAVYNADAQNSDAVAITGNSVASAQGSPAGVGINLFWGTYGTQSGCVAAANVLKNYIEGIHIGGGAAGAVSAVTMAVGNSIIGCTYGVAGWGNLSTGTVRQVGTNISDGTGTLFYSHGHSCLFGKIVSKTAITAVMASAGYSGGMPSRSDGFEGPAPQFNVTTGATSFNLFAIGGPLRGRVKYQGKNSNTDWCHISADINWDGTTFTVSNVLSRMTGRVNAISIVKNGSDVAVSMTGSAAVQLYAGWIEFDGEYWDA
jgi:hypothetical protein